MIDRAEIHARFVAQFAFGDRPLPFGDADLDSIEVALDTVLPTAYRCFMKSYGSVYTPSLLDEIEERNLDFPDFHELFSPLKAVEGTTGYWSAGMPVHLIGFGNDCMGNMFTFERVQRGKERLDDQAVLFFDHDFVDVRKLTESFDALLEWYLENLRKA